MTSLLDNHQIPNKKADDIIESSSRPGGEDLGL
jgi:hypothetical protein